MDLFIIIAILALHSGHCLDYHGAHVRRESRQDLTQSSSEEEARVKKGGALDIEDSSDDDESQQLVDPQSDQVTDSLLINFKHPRGSRSQQYLNFLPNFPFLDDYNNHHRINRFYYFNEDLPATSFQSGKIGRRMDRKRQLPPNNGEPKWEPLTVETSSGPFHFHLPVLHNSKKSKDVSESEMLREATYYKNPLDFDFASIPLYVADDDRPWAPAIRPLIRKRRGFGNWIRKVFHRPKKVPPSTTSERPHKPATTTESSYSTELEDFKGQVRYFADQHGDTEVDWLLPKSLRRSSLLAKKYKDSKDGANDNNWEEDYEWKRPTRPLPIMPKGSHRRRRPLPPQPPRQHPISQQTWSDLDPAVYSYDDYDQTSKSEPKPFGSRRHKRAATLTSSSGPAKLRRHQKDTTALPQMNLPWEPIIHVSLDAEPIIFASKEELRLLHELFVNIVTEKCPKGFQARFAEAVEENIFKTLDATDWPSSENETSGEMSALIHQLVNCSTAAEGQKDILQLLLLEDRMSKFHVRNEIEMGSPLYRQKRRRLKQSKKKLSKEQIYKEARNRMSNIEFALVAFISAECKHHVDNQLLLSASQLILEALPRRFVFYRDITEEDTRKNLGVLQNCASLIMKHRENEYRLKRKLQDSVRLLHGKRRRRTR